MPSLPHFIKFIQRGWFNSNSILIEHEGKPTLIDSGSLMDAEETEMLIRNIGVQPENLGLIVTTHGHSDHHGGNKRLKKLSNAPIAMGEITADWFRNNQHHLYWLDMPEQDGDIVLPDRVIKDSEIVQFSGIPFEAVHLPGHAPDCIGFYQPDSKVMICADAMWENDLGVLNTAVHGPNILKDAEFALDRLSNLDIEIAIPGHGNLIYNVRENIEKVRNRLRSFQDDPKQLAWHFLRRISMYVLMRFQPIKEEPLLEILASHNHLIYFINNHLNIPESDTKAIRQLFRNILENFKERKLVIEKDGFLSSTVPK